MDARHACGSCFAAECLTVLFHASVPSLSGPNKYNFHESEGKWLGERDEVRIDLLCLGVGIRMRCDAHSLWLAFPPAALVARTSGPRAIGCVRQQD